MIYREAPRSGRFDLLKEQYTSGCRAFDVLARPSPFAMATVQEAAVKDVLAGALAGTFAGLPGGSG